MEGGRARCDYTVLVELEVSDKCAYKYRAR